MILAIGFYVLFKKKICVFFQRNTSIEKEVFFFSRKGVFVRVKKLGSEKAKGDVELCVFRPSNWTRLFSAALAAS